MPRKSMFKTNQRDSLIFYVSKNIKRALKREARKKKLSVGELLRQIVAKEVGEIEERKKEKGQIEIPREIFGQAYHE